MSASSSSKEAPRPLAPAEAALRFVRLLLAVAAGLVAAVAGVLASTPLPTVLFRAAAVAAGTRVLAGWIGAALLISLRRTPVAAPRAAEVDR
ncbi:MAG TPA: hypothetical protein VEI02_02570 [Planctomycetota bacterium]|nr:hypothetical protein [Planctomycetota bacterium]